MTVIKENNVFKTQTIAFAAAMMAAVTMLASGCSESPQAQYERAAQGLKQARQAQAKAQKEVAEKKAELAQLQDKLDAAQKRLAKAKARMKKASAKVNKSVNDDVLFRTIQKQMLDKDKFGDAAIAVGVKNRVVTLTGTVPDEAARKKAVKKAGSHAGVKEVVDFLDVKGEKASDQDRDDSAGQRQQDNAPSESNQSEQ